MKTLPNFCEFDCSVVMNGTSGHTNEFPKASEIGNSSRIFNFFLQRLFGVPGAFSSLRKHFCDSTSNF
jgi:hypothetical protein